MILLFVYWVETSMPNAKIYESPTNCLLKCLIKMWLLGMQLFHFLLNEKNKGKTKPYYSHKGVSCMYSYSFGYVKPYWKHVMQSLWMSVDNISITWAHIIAFYPLVQLTFLVVLDVLMMHRTLLKACQLDPSFFFLLIIEFEHGFHLW